MKKLSDEIIANLKTIADDCDKEDRSTRERQIRTWKRLKLLWEGFTQVWYSEVAHDWRIFEPETNTDQSSYDKPVNVFRAYLESIIAALSILVPPVKCYPDDADNSLDLSTARAGDQIAALIYRHNNVPLLWIHALFLYVTEGMVGCYTYSKADEKFGTYEEKKYEDDEELHHLSNCPNCGHTLDDEVVSPDTPPIPPVQPPAVPNPMDSANVPPDMGALPPEGMEPQIPQPPMEPPMVPPQEEMNMAPMDAAIGPQEQGLDVSPADEFMPGGAEQCPMCGQWGVPHKTEESFVVTRLVGVTKEPKSRICMEAYGGLNIKVPNHARRQSDCPYLIFDYELDYALAIEQYPDLHGVIKGGGRATEEYDQWARLSPQYQGEYPENVVTVKHAWIRPAKFNILGDKEDIKELRKHFPNGVKVSFVNNEFAEAVNESLDDSWTLTYNPLSDHIHFDPLGLLLSSIQEITNDIISLTLQTIEHGIGSTFADPGVLNFRAYEQTEVVPGGIFPAVPKTGKSISDGFHELRTATLSTEVLPFAHEIQSMGQLVSGALPSLYGGSIEGSETASQYSMSRAQSMQRLQNTWKMLTCWWKEIFSKVIPLYIKDVKDDERDVQRDTTGNFINIFIRKAELEGKIGKVELEANENIPLTWAQRKEVIEKLLENSNPEIMKIIASPENLPLIHEALGLHDFFVPGEADREKQYDEIKLLVNSEPIVQPPDPMMAQQAMMTGQPPPPEQELPSVEVEQEVDDHEIQYTICRKWLISEAGRQAKQENPQGYKNVLLHARMHLQIVQQSMMQQQQQQPQAGPANPEKPGQSTEEPITGEGDVQTIQ